MESPTVLVPAIQMASVVTVAPAKAHLIHAAAAAAIIVPNALAPAVVLTLMPPRLN